MRFPRSVPIKGVKWKVRVVPSDHPALGDDCCGTYDLHNQTIYIDRGLSIPLRWATFYHEVFHIIAIGHERFDLCEESYVETLSGEVYAIVVYLEKGA